MLVIAILGLLFVVFSRISFQPQENLTKAERLANKISSVLHGGLLQITIGKMDGNNPPSAVTGAIFTLGTSACPLASWGSWITWYYTSTSSGKLLPPYFDTDIKYAIDNIKWSWWVASWTGDCIQINMTRDAMSFTGAWVDTTSTIMTVTTRYLGMKKKVTFDRRTGRVEVNKN